MKTFIDSVRKGNLVDARRLLSQADLTNETLALNAALYNFPPDGGVQNDPREITERLAQIAEGLLKQMDASTGRKKAEACYRLGCIALRQEDMISAKMRFEEAAVLAPDVAAVFHNLGYVNEMLADTTGARAAYTKALELDPHLTLSQVNLGMVLLLEGNREAALNELGQANSQNPDSLTACTQLVWALLNSGESDDIQQAQQVLADYTGERENSTFLDCQGAMQLAVRQFEAAEQSFRDSLKSSPNREFATVGLLRALAGKRDFTALLVEAELMQSTKPSRKLENVIAAIQVL